MEHSLLSSAFYRVGLVADQTWWTEKDFSDSYKLASLGLWNEVIDSNERLSNWGSDQDQLTCKQTDSTSGKSFEKQGLTGNQIPKKDKMVMPTCRMEVAQMQKALTLMDPIVLAPLPQSILTDARCIFSANWPVTLLKTYPALTSALKNNNTLSIFSHKHAIGNMYKDGNPLPYSIDTIEELMYHKKIASPAVKNVWSNDDEKTAFNKTVWEPRLNANVPEFYPSVLLPPRQCPPRYSNVFGANYQSEVFPYNDDKQAVDKKERETAKQKKKCHRGLSEQRSTYKGVVSSSTPNLLRSVQNCKVGTQGKETSRSDLNYWLPTVYPPRVVELSKFRSMSRHIGAISHRVTPPFPQPLASPAALAPSSERRLYRDVLARKLNDAIDKTKDETEQNPFDELERQALEQYQSSETCLVNQTQGIDINPDPEDSKFQDLEREALEQYAEDVDQMERNSESPNPDEISFLAGTQPIAFCSGTIDMQFVHFKDGQSDMCQSAKIEKNIGEAAIEPEAIVKSVVGDDKYVEGINGLSEANERLCSIETKDSSYELLKGLDLGKNKSKAKKNTKKKNKRLGDEEKFSTKHDQMRSVSGMVLCQLPNVMNIEEETRRVATNLKHKVLNYLRNVDLKKIKELDESKKTNVKYQLSKDPTDRPIQERIRVADIDDLETYRSYIREVSTKARSSLLLQFKRIRSEIMESTSRGIVSLVSPTTREKRRVRQIIRKCLELRNHADKTPKNPLNGVKREVNETLETVHSTMEVIYTLSNLSKEAFKDVEFLKSGKTLVPELYTGSTTLEDKSEYIRQRVMVDERSILLVLLFPRIPGVLYDRSYEELKKPNSHLIYYDHDLLRTDYAILSKNSTTASLLKETNAIRPYHQTDVEVYNVFKYSKMESKAIWDPSNWSHVTKLGKNRHRINFRFSSTGRQAETFCRVLSKTLRVQLVARNEEIVAISPRKRRLSTLASTRPEPVKKP